MIKNVNALIAASILVLSSTAYAGFDVMMDDELESNPNKYGNAHTVQFRKAMQGDDSVSLNEDRPLADQNAIDVAAPKIGHTSFIAARLGRPHTTLKKVSNSGSSLSTLAPTQSGEADHLFNFSLAWGYRWIRWAVDAELMFTEGMDFNLNPVFQDQPQGLNNSISNSALFFNLHYFFPRYFNWMPEALAPHLNFGLGPNYKRIKSELMQNNQALAAKTDNSFDLAWNLSFGLAYRITNNFLVDLSWRYLDYGDAKFGPTTATIAGVSTTAGIKANDFKSSGFHFGLLYEMD